MRDGEFEPTKPAGFDPAVMKAIDEREEAIVAAYRAQYTGEERTIVIRLHDGIIEPVANDGAFHLIIIDGDVDGIFGDEGPIWNEDDDGNFVECPVGDEGSDSRVIYCLNAEHAENLARLDSVEKAHGSLPDDEEDC